MDNKSVLLCVIVFLVSSCSALYMGGEDSGSKSGRDERVYADLGSYDDENPTLNDYVQNDYHNSNYYNAKAGNNSNLKQGNVSRNSVNANNNFDYRAKPKSINNYNYPSNNQNINNQKTANSRQVMHGEAKEKDGFFGRLYGSVKDFFIIEEEDSQVNSARGSLNTNQLPVRNKILSKRTDWMGRLHFPVNHPEAALTSAFGWRKGKFHEGIDVAAPYGSVVEAAYDAKVIYSGDLLGGYGNMLVLQSKGGLVTVYSHNAKLYVKKGDVVRRGEVIALVGDSGNATAPHLHFEVRLANPNGDFVAVNPDGLFR